MAVQRIEQYRQQNGVDILKVFCKPTKLFPDGSYFYSPADAIDLVQDYCWFLSKYKYVNTVFYQNFYCKHLLFHRELCYLYKGFYSDYLDHIDIVEYDNVAENLNIVTNTQNGQNKFTRGYKYQFDGCYFRTQLRYQTVIYHPYTQLKREDLTCHLQYLAETEYLKNLMGNDYYQFDFKKYRRGSEDILDLERTGVISEEEATYRHILKYAENAWFYLRYGLKDYFRQYHIPVPSYSLDENGFMRHNITGQMLCPFPYNPKC